MNPTNERRYYPALAGLRGLAILLVVFLHNFGFLHVFFFGWLGVDLFFVISGFLITDILLDSVNRPHFLRNFYMRRLLRIFPLYYFALILCLFVLPRFSNIQLNVDYYVNNQAWMWTYLQNWLFIFKPPYGDSILLHTWSLAVEEQFYLFWPLIILLVRKPIRLLWIALFVLIMVGVTRYVLWINHYQDLSYASLYTFTRIDGICIGAMIALLFRIQPEFLKKNTTIIVLLMAVINFGFYFVNHKKGFTLPYMAFVGYTTFAVLFGVLLYEAVRNETKWIRFIFTNKLLTFFGKISYGFYVYHWPVYLLVFPYLAGWLHDSFHLSPRTAAFGSAVSVTLLAIIVSFLSYQFLERPLLRLKKNYN